MSFFSWFSNKPVSLTKPNMGDEMKMKSMRLPRAVLPQVAAAAKPAANVGGPTSPLGVERKVKRHARREQLYVAIRESMTRAGMLSASYKFKVLSLDQNGNQFLVMMDVAAELSTSARKLSQTEEVLMQTAKAGYGITVTAVYWRVDPKTVKKLPQPPIHAVTREAVEAVRPSTIDAFAETQANTPLLPQERAQPATISVPIKPASSAKPRNDPMLEAEVAAFKRALSAASAAAPAAAVAAATAASAAMTAPYSNTASTSQGGLKSYTLITGFEDTEMPDSPATPALSATQYGELN